MLTRDSFDRMDEAALRQNVLIPLLRAMAYKDVYEFHGGSGEQGKDIVCWKPDELDSRVNLAIVAKATPMSGKAKLAKATASELQTQIRQCFGKPYNDPVTSEEQLVHRVWVVSNKKISKEAQDAIKSAVASTDLMRNVQFIPGDNLWALVEKHLPSSLFHFVEEVRKRTKDADTHYKHRITINGDQVSVALEEKYPGAATEKPVTFTAKFVDGAATAAYQEKIRHYQETGETTEIPADLIDTVEVPDFFRQMLGIETNPISSEQIKITFIPPPVPKEKPARVRFLCDDGDQYVREYVLLRGVQGGTKEVTVVSEERDAPFRLTIQLRGGADADGFTIGSLNISTREGTYNAVQYSEWLRLAVCLSKPCIIQLDSVEDGFIFLQGRLNSGMMEAPNPKLIEFYNRLATIQRMMKVPIYLPDRALTHDEIRTVDEVFQIVTTGRAKGTWNESVMTFGPNRNFIDGILNAFSEGKSGTLVLEAEETANILDAELKIGRVRKTLFGTRLKNLDEVRENYDDLCSADASIEMVFTADEGSEAVSEYFDWLPADKKPQLMVLGGENEAPRRRPDE